MKTEIIESSRTVMSNPRSKHNYFAWPTVTRLKNGRLALGASGFRLRHVCPFGKVALSFSDDEGKTWSLPMIAIDTPLDDRDAGLCPFGESGLVLTSFTNDRKLQYSRLKPEEDNRYIEAYLEKITDEDEKKYLGYTYTFSSDNGVTFDEPRLGPVTSPHGPIVRSDGSILWIGRKFDNDTGDTSIQAYKIFPDKEPEYVSTLPRSEDYLIDCEPHAIQLPDGRILCHIRSERKDPRIFTLYQTESSDGGVTWTKPERILGETGGAPAHLLLTSKGKLICVYAKRTSPQKILAMISSDLGRTWEQDFELADGPNWDLGYPSTVELKNGDLLTIYYAHDEIEGPAVIKQVIWRLGE